MYDGEGKGSHHPLRARAVPHSYSAHFGHFRTLIQSNIYKAQCTTPTSKLEYKLNVQTVESQSKRETIDLISENHRMSEVGGDLWVHLIQLLLEKGYTEQGAENHGQVAFEDLQGDSRIFPT